MISGSRLGVGGPPPLVMVPELPPVVLEPPVPKEFDPASTPVVEAALLAPDDTEVDTPPMPPPALARSRSVWAMRGP